MGRLLKRILRGIGNVLSFIFNQGIKLKYVLALLLIFVGGAVALTYTKMLDRVGGKTDYSEAMRYIELKNICEEKYIDEVDRASMTDSSSAAIVSGLGDKWSYYMTPDEYDTYQLYNANDYTDIGISMIKNEEGGGFYIVSVTPNTPSFEGGLASGMIITAIAGQDVTNMDIDGVRKLIRSNLDKEFIITVNGKEDHSINCASTYSSAVSYRLEKTEAGYIQIKNFEAGSGQDAINAIEDLLSQKAVALCIDVRNNPGGLPEEITKLLDYLIPNGELFSIVDKQGHKESIRSDAMSLSLPMVVLINSGTYAEAEVFAAVLQEYQWAELMGEPTTGMTRMQETFEFEDGSAVRLSTKSYLTPNGVDICLSNGIIPGTIIYNEDPNSVGTTDGTLGTSGNVASTSDDTQLLAALKYLS